MSVCPALPVDVGIVRDILGSVDCNVQLYSAAGYRALTGPDSPLPAALTGMLTIYVALLGYRMLFAVGGTRLADTPLIAVKIGAILAITLNWSVFQTLVFDLDANAPMQIGRVISRPMAQNGPGLAEDPVRGLQVAYDELNADALQLSTKAGQANASTPGSPPSPGVDAAKATAAALRQAATVLVGSTAGVLAMAFIATGVLTAVGPLFIALFLFDATRGFFTGWVRALVGAMLTPMVCWIATSLMLVVLAPRIAILAEQRAAQLISLDVADAACALVLIFAGAQAVLILGGLMVAGGFDLSRRSTPAESSRIAAPEGAVGGSVVEVQTRAQALAASLQRSSATYSRETGGGAVSLASIRGEPDGMRTDGPARPDRLGETFRRGVTMRDRTRTGAAGRA